MAKYFSGITINGSKYAISIIDDNLNIIFMDNLEIDRLIELLKRKSVSTLSIDFPLSLYLKYPQANNSQSNNKILVKKRSCDNMLSSKQLFTYNNRFCINETDKILLSELSAQLCKLGFSVRAQGESEKSIIESYPDTSFLVLGCAYNENTSEDDVLRKKYESLKNKGIRIKDFLKKNKKDTLIETNTLCQAYAAYAYFSGESTCYGNAEEGILVLPSKNIYNKVRTPKVFQKSPKLSISSLDSIQSKPVVIENMGHSMNTISKIKLNSKITAEYCGAQYLYTNIDGIIRINELRPIKSYRPFTEIYEMKQIRQVQVIIGTTDGLRRVKANLIPNAENSNSFKAAEEEDKKKLDSFWGNTGDKRGYLIKFNKVEVVKA